MIKRLLSFSFVFLVGGVLGTEAAAQRVSAETTLGFSVGGGGAFANREGMALDLLLGMQLRETSAGTLVGGLTAGLYGPITSDLICLIGPGGECLPDFPTFLSAGALLGVERGSASGFSARLLAGPTYYWAHPAYEGAHAEHATLGLQGRFDIATPPVLHTSVVASLKGAVLPRFQGDPLVLGGFGLGLRIQ